MRLITLVFLAACATPDMSAPPELDAADGLAKTKELGGANGAFDYCDGAVTCDVGEGDCDTDAQCSAGLVCVDDLGGNYGLSWTTDVCAPATCENGVQDAGETGVDFGGDCGTVCPVVLGGLESCTTGCPCDVGEGDCDVDGDCVGGLVCAEDNGTQWGLNWTYETCVPDTCTNGVLDAGETAIDFGGDCGSECGGVNGNQEGFCSPGCPCDVGEGDCDIDEECATGLRCTWDQGGQFGLLSSIDVCMAVLTVADLQPGDLIITEFMKEPLAVGDGDGEWFEVYNASGQYVELDGLVVRDDGNNDFIVDPYELGINQRMVFGKQTDPALNGGVVVNYDYPSAFQLGNNDDEIVLEANGVEIDRVAYDNGVLWVETPGSSYQLDRADTLGDNNNAANWCVSILAMSGGDKGSPGRINRFCP